MERLREKKEEESITSAENLLLVRNGVLSRMM
jgi:hypothetical protein